MYPFGYGMSYSQFEISNIRCNKETVPVELVSDKGEIINTRMPVLKNEIKVYADVKNLGPDAHGEGQEVIQLYIRDIHASISKPVKELKAFKKVRLNPNETKTVELALSIEDFASFDGDIHEWEAEEGIYEILIGTSVSDIVGSIKVYLDTKSTYSYGIGTTIKRLYEDTVVREHLFMLFDGLGLDRGYIMTKYEYEPSCTLDRLLKEIYKGDYPVSETVMAFLSRVSAIKRV